MFRLVQTILDNANIEMMEVPLTPSYSTKGGFFQKVRFVFQISQSPKKIIPKNYPELEI